ncbi:hypothetical protein [Desulfovibrio sp. 3_1_syn3]|uniref:hypothetical protein n=1 Tax=Desulfovibrio sp. 3_1_syn3 TaxID=457398 RepID=UPI0006866E26|nr:hypothetical protein [Desulfovibrio sp. 3_1_syn3]
MAETAGYISYGVTLPDAQRCRVAPVTTKKQPPQIGHLAAHNREQFRVRAGLTGKALPGEKNPDIRSGHGYPLCVGTAQFPGNAGKGGISHVASAFDHARRADTRPAAGFFSQIAVDPVSGDADTGSK